MTVHNSSSENISRFGETELEALIRRAYEGEIIGSAMYQALMTCETTADHDALRLLYELERVTANALEPVVARYNVSTDHDAATAEGLKLASELVQNPWNSMWANIVELADDYLRDFYRLMTALEGTEYSSIGRQVVEHEEALIEFARREVEQLPDPTAPLRAYLTQYVS